MLESARETVYKECPGRDAPDNAGVVELADARDSKSRVRKDMRVRPPPPAPGESQGSGKSPGPFSFEPGAQEGVERARIAERLARKSATHGSAEDPSPAAIAAAMDRRRLRRATPSSGTSCIGLERARGADEQEEKRDARERASPEPRRKGRWLGWAAPLLNELRSLGYPATNSPRGKAQAGESLLRHQLIKGLADSG